MTVEEVLRMTTMRRRPQEEKEEYEERETR
jgi:hypothetical protein